MRILEYTDSGVYSFTPEEQDRSVLFLDEGLLVLSDDEVKFFALNDRTTGELDDILVNLWNKVDSDES